MISNPIAVFDSGVGSLSIIRELKREMPNENMLYLADRAHYPYGNKSHQELRNIIFNTLKYLQRYKPKLIVLASNTPSVQVLDEIRKVIDVPLLGVKPPLKRASRLTKMNHIGVMATERTLLSKELEDQIRREVPQKILITRFNASPIIDLIENGTFLTDERRTFNTILRVMDKDNNKDISKNIDVITLSSSHLPFVKNYLTALMPTINFVDPSRSVAVEVKKFLISNRMLKKNGRANLLVLVSAEKRHFEKIIHAMGIKEYVTEVDLTF